MREDTMTDRELLERAAKAAGYWDHQHNCWNGEPSVSWNPLHDDGDALRLAVHMEMDVFVRGGRWTEAVRPMSPACKQEHDDDPLAATRRAIVRAAAHMAA